MTSTLPYGAWPSPLSAAAVASASPRLEGAAFAGDDVWWGQSVAAEGGRIAVMRADASGAQHVVLPAPWNARSSVHEYGGGAWAVSDDGVLVFVEKTDQRVWLLDGDTPRALTPADAGFRFGGLSIQHGTLLAIREADNGTRTPTRDIVSVPWDGSAENDASAVISLVAGSDFLAQPALSPDRGHLAWVAWDHPNMPWDETEVRVGALEGGVVSSWERIATGGATVALQPVWTSAERLVFTDDISGRWNLQQFTLGDPAPTPIAPAEADTGGGLWVLGLKWFGVLDDGRIVACRTHGSDEIVLLDADGDVTSLGIDAIAYTVIEDVSGTQALISTTGADGTAAIWRIDVDRPGVAQRVAGGESPWEDEWMPRARPVTFDGPRGPVHAFDFPPTSPAFSGPDEELPPYVVFVHGGPTTHVGGAASGKIAHLTSRGIGVLDVNYGGSTGYGRAYRERLRGEWGVVDVEDVVAAARYLAEERLADPRRVAIAGGSAGGWTVLCALARSDAFAAGISRYGVADLRLLAADTGDFESRYLDSMVGPLPDAEQLYIERSPLSHLAGLTTPMLIEQGLDDAVVPPSQSEAVRDALAANGVPHAYLAFAGEGHGFRRAETIITTLDAELSFLGQVFGFTPPGVPDLILA